MKRAISISQLATCSLAAMVLAASQNSFAHTRLQTPQVDENSANHGADYNNEVISHGCDNDAAVIGTTVVFPDGVDSIITVNGEATSQPLTDFVQNYGNPVQKIQSRAVFTMEGEKTTSLGNVIGFWAGLNGMPGTYIGLLPFRTSGVVIEPTSCARSVTFRVAIADVCVITPVSGFNNDTVNLWTPAVGSDFDGPGLDGFDSPATLKVNRSIEPLPASCGEGVDVVVTPSAAQLNRDMPVILNGVQVWPQP